MGKIPKDLQGLFWSRKLDSLDLLKDKSYIVNQILAYGSLEQIKWLFRTYSEKEIKETFFSQPRKVYTPQSFNFVKNYILDLESRKVPAGPYVKIIF